MSKNKGYTKEYIMSILNRLGVKESNGMIVIPKDSVNNLGIKIWGMIDFLKMPWSKR